MNKRNLTIPFILILFAAAYTFGVAKLEPERLVLWLNTMVGTTLSAMFALITGMAIFEAQRKVKAKAAKADMTMLLKAELSDVRRSLSESGSLNIHFDSGSMSVLVTNIQPLVLEKAALSGIYSELDSENLIHIARKLRVINQKMEHLLSCLRSNSGKEMIIHACNNVEESRVAILADIDFICQKLALQLSDNYPESIEQKSSAQQSA